MTAPHDLPASPKRWPRFLAARLDPKSYLGLHFTIGLAATALALWLFSGLLEEVLDNATMVHLDLRAAAWIHGAQSPMGVRVFELFTNLGSPAVMTTLAVVGVGTLLVTRHRLLAYVWAMAAAGGAVLDWALKLLIHRGRPEYAAAFLHRASYSFPSGHAMGSAIGFGMLAFAVAHARALSRRARQRLYAAAAVAAFLVGLSRVYLAVHFPSDVVGGWAAGAGWLSLCITAYHLVIGRARSLHPEST
jgi:undecaprenyl-diphosphatase